jgi:drug/metabolite transporter (DMT)-like permease
MKYLLFIISITAESIKEICYKKSSDYHYMDSKISLNSLKWILFGIIFWAFEYITRFYIYSYFELNSSFAILSLAYCIVPLFCHFFLNEKLSNSQWFGVLMITVGVSAFDI